MECVILFDVRSDQEYDFLVTRPLSNVPGSEDSTQLKGFGCQIQLACIYLIDIVLCLYYNGIEHGEESEISNYIPLTMNCFSCFNVQQETCSIN